VKWSTSRAKMILSLGSPAISRKSSTFLPYHINVLKVLSMNNLYDPRPNSFHSRKGIFTPLESRAAPSGPEALWAGGCSGDENYSFFSEHGV
jgi:hypothetical protein